MAAAEEKRLLRLYRSYLREHVGQIRAKRRNPSAKAQSARQPVVDASTDRRLKPQNLLLRPDNQTFQREETYPRRQRFSRKMLKAAKVSNADAVSSFLAKGADVNYQDPRKGYTGLHWAAWNGALGVIRVLIDAKANIDAVNKQGETAMRSAIVAGRVKAAKLLSEAPRHNQAKATGHAPESLPAATPPSTTASADSHCPGQLQPYAGMTTERDSNVDAIGGVEAALNITRSLDERKKHLLRIFNMVDGGDNGSAKATMANDSNDSGETNILDQNNHFAQLQTAVESILGSTRHMVETQE